MKRPLRPEETRLWAVVAATVRPSAARAAATERAAAVARATALAEPEPAPRTVAPPKPRPKSAKGPAPTAPKPAPPRPTPLEPQVVGPHIIEPRRKHRIARGREVIEARLDLHGLDQDRARARLLDFLLQAQAGGARAVLVITGKGEAGQGVLRRRTPEWLADPRLRGVVAGLSPAETHHGGEGAFYIALKRKAR